MTELESFKEKKNKRQKWIILILLLLLLVVVGGGIFLWKKGFFDTPVQKSRLERDREALAGQLVGKSESEIQDILNQKVQEGMVTVSVLGDIYAEKNGEKVRLGVQNDASNNYSFIIDMKLTDTDETIYSSNLIDPGYYIEYVTLNKTLSEGDYPVQVVFTTYALDETDDPIASSVVDATLHVSSDTLFEN